MMKTKQQIQKWILDNCVDSDGYIDLMGLDFGHKAVFLSGMKAKTISQIEHKADETSQWRHKADVIYKIEHKADETSQWRHKADVMEGGHISINEMTIKEEVKQLREEIEILKKKLNDN